MGQRLKLLLYSLMATGLSACGSIEPSTFLSERSPAQSRATSLISKGENEVAVYLQGQRIKYMEAPTRTYLITSRGSRANLQRLSEYILANQVFLDVLESASLQLRVGSVTNRGSKTYVRFEHIIERRVAGRAYIIPVESSEVVAALEGGRLQSLNSRLKTPPSISFVLDHPGFDLRGFSETELTLFLRHMTASPRQNQIRDYFANIAQNSNLEFDYEAFLKLTSPKQLQSLRIFFGKIKATSTAKILIELARDGRLAYVKHGTEWMFQVTNWFELPLQFDFLFPTPGNKAQKLRVRNLREMHESMAAEVYAQPNYPGGKSDLLASIADIGTDISVDAPATDVTVTELAQPQDRETARMLQSIVLYFRRHHSWIGFDGVKPALIKALTRLQVPPWNENAFWYKATSSLVIGAGGSSLQNLAQSPSVLGHEYTHGVIDFSSGLHYRNQSGAINEHFADIQGAGIEAAWRQKPFDYTIGEDILSPDLVTSKKITNDLELKNLKTGVSEIEKFSLDQVALRQMYLPSLGVYVQPSHMQEADTSLAAGCEPSVDNDHCGVHVLSGVLNRATSMIIGVWGFEKTRSLIFNTVTARLEANADFQEYLRQLHEECLETKGFSLNDCALIPTSFASVGINYPSAPNLPPQTAEIEADEPTPAPTPADPTPTPPPDNKPREVCAAIKPRANGDWHFIDNSQDAVLVLEKNKAQARGFFTRIQPSDLQLVMKARCACAMAFITPAQNLQGAWFKGFSQVIPGTVVLKSPTQCAGIQTP